MRLRKTIGTSMLLAMIAATGFLVAPTVSAMQQVFAIKSTVTVGDGGGTHTIIVCDDGTSHEV